MCNSCLIEEVPEDQWNMVQKDFMGKEFPTPKGGLLKVTGVSKENFILNCSICSEDKELWSRGSILCTKNNLIQGRTPCGCSKHPTWREWQNKIRVQRECDKIGYIFHGWFGEYKGSTTYLDLENPETGNRWNTVNINKLLFGRGDPSLKTKICRQANILPDQKHIQDFYNAGFTEDYKFWRSDKQDTTGRKPYWYCTCPVCSNDEYVKAGVCSGVFEVLGSNIKKGSKFCRCSDNYRWTQEQREYQISKICKEEGLTFISWVDENGYENNNSKFTWICHVGHICSTSVSKFLSGRRCKTCQRESGGCFGYYEKRLEEEDTLYIISFGKYIKVGRTFNITSRIRGLISESGVKKHNIKILYTTQGNHKVIYELEQYIHNELTLKGFYYNGIDGRWSNELFYKECLNILTGLINKAGFKLVTV